VNEAPPADGTRREDLPLREFLYHLHQGRHSAAVTFAAVFCFSLFIASLIPPSYKATAAVTVLPAPEFTARPEAGSPGVNNTALAMDQILQTESAILDSDDIHEAALRHVGLDAVYPDLDPSFRPGPLSDAVHGMVRIVLSPWRPAVRDVAAGRLEQALSRFHAHLTILPSKDGNVISVSFTHLDPAIAAQLVNVLIGSYAAQRNKIYTDPQLDVLRNQAASQSQSVAQAEQALADYKRLHDISDPVTQRELLLHRRSDAERTQAEAAGVAQEQKARLETLSAQLRSEPVTVGLFQEHDPDTRVQTLLASVQDLRGRLAAARGRYLDSSKLVKDLNAQILSRQDELKQLVRDPSASIMRTGRNPAIDQLRLDRAHAAAELAAAVARRDAAGDEVKQVSRALATLDANDLKLATLQRRVNLETDDLVSSSRILAARQLTEAEDALRFTRVRVIQAARIPQRPRTFPLLVIAAGFLMALLAAAGRLVAGFMLHETFFTAQGVEFACGLDVLAVFPEKSEATRFSLA
jgi:uncharacterized protein involved in exopolysaccharide biosynthesis